MAVRSVFSASRFLCKCLQENRCISRYNFVKTYYTYSKEPFQPLNRQPKWTSAEEAVSAIKSGDTVFVHGAAATPRILVPAMAEYGKKASLKDVTVCHIHTEGAAEYTRPEYQGIFRSNSFFVGGNCREPINSGRADFVPIFLSEIPLLFHRGLVPCDVAMLQVTPPDNHGYCSFGTSVDTARAAVQHSKYIIGAPFSELNKHMKGRSSVRVTEDAFSDLVTRSLIISIITAPNNRINLQNVQLKDLEDDDLKFYNENIALDDDFSIQICEQTINQSGNLWTTERRKRITGQVNPRMPRTFGDGIIHVSHFDALVQGEMELPELKSEKLGEVELAIGKLIADNLVEDGATLQMGIGSIPDAVLASLRNHKDLGVHSEMFSDGVVDLVELGCITNHHKKICPGKIVGSFTIGSRRLFDFMHDNPFIVMLVVDYVNDNVIIASNPKVTAINSCIEIDLTGQVVSDSIGTRIYSGVGGQVDFLRGAAMAFDGKGKAILAMPSTTNKGESKIVPFLKQGGGVVTSRAHIHYAVTEYGIAYLFGKNIRQRAHALIEIAHPKHRESLEKAAYERLKCMPSP